MKLIEALKIQNSRLPSDAKESRYRIVCGFEPLHLLTFFKAELLRRKAGYNIRVEGGLFGDFLGNLAEVTSGEYAGCAIVLEWSEIDARLGIRYNGKWGAEILDDVLKETRIFFERLSAHVHKIARTTPVVICQPTLPVLPLGQNARFCASETWLGLEALCSAAMSDLAAISNVRIADRQFQDLRSDPAKRFDVRSALVCGFPYSLAHASQVAEVLADLLILRAPKKALITDLDETLWRGIVGEVGSENVSWNLEDSSQMHALYQNLLTSLAGAGVLIGVASKNAEEDVKAVLNRKDLLADKDIFFPLEIGWNRKSESVTRILEIWNISADSVIFIDDNPSEIAEVKNSFPDMECILFPTYDEKALFDLFGHLRDRFGRDAILKEDILRRMSLRQAHTSRSRSPAVFRNESSSPEIKGEVLIESCHDMGDGRALDLINKTNQFNLNGRRLDVKEFSEISKKEGCVILVISYEDKFGALGRIAAIIGETINGSFEIKTWTMSCRAFGRHIEHHCLDFIFSSYAVNRVVFNWQKTARNDPMAAFLHGIGISELSANPHISKEQFYAAKGNLPHTIKRGAP